MVGWQKSVIICNRANFLAPEFRFLVCCVSFRRIGLLKYLGFSNLRSFVFRHLCAHSFPARRLVYCASRRFYWNCHFIGGGWYHPLFSILCWFFFSGGRNITQFEFFHTRCAILGDVCNNANPNSCLVDLVMAKTRQQRAILERFEIFGCDYIWLMVAILFNGLVCPQPAIHRQYYSRYSRSQ